MTITKSRPCLIILDAILFLGSILALIHCSLKHLMLTHSRGFGGGRLPSRNAQRLQDCGIRKSQIATTVPTETQKTTKALTPCAVLRFPHNLLLAFPSFTTPKCHQNHTPPLWSSLHWAKSIHILSSPSTAEAVMPNDLAMSSWPPRTSKLDFPR